MRWLILAVAVAFGCGTSHATESAHREAMAETARFLCEIEVRRQYAGREVPDTVKDMGVALDDGLIYRAIMQAGTGAILLECTVTHQQTSWAVLGVRAYRHR